MAPTTTLMPASTTLMPASTAAPTPTQAPVPDPQDTSTSSSASSSSGGHGGAIAPAHIIIAAVTVTLILVASTFGCVMLRRRKLRERANGGRLHADPEVKFRVRNAPSTKASRRRSRHGGSGGRHDARHSRLRDDARNSDMSYTHWLETGLPVKELGGSSAQSSDELTLMSGHEVSPPPEYDASVEKAHLASEKF
jgi:hypothetical protein